MKSMEIVTNNSTVKLDAANIAEIKNEPWGLSLSLGRPVYLDGKEVLTGSNIVFPEGTVFRVPGREVTCSGRTELMVTELFSELQVYVGQTPNNSNEVVSVKGIDYQDLNEGRISGKFGPFQFTVDAHLDLSDIYQSHFYVTMTVFGVKIVDCKLDLNNPNIQIGAEVLGVGVIGEVGIDFNKSCIYAKITLKYLIGKQDFNFILYSWA